MTTESSVVPCRFDNCLPCEFLFKLVGGGSVLTMVIWYVMVGDERENEKLPMTMIILVEVKNTNKKLWARDSLPPPLCLFPCLLIIHRKNLINANLTDL